MQRWIVEAFKKIKTGVEVEFEEKMKALCTDQVGEFTSNEFNTYGENHGLNDT